MSKLASTLLERDSGVASRFSPFQQPHLMLLTHAKPVSLLLYRFRFLVVLQLLKIFEFLTVGSR